MDTKTILYELGFLDKNGNPARDKDRRWHVGLNQAELIIKTALKEVKNIETFILLREDFQMHMARMRSNGEQYAIGYEDALSDIRNYIHGHRGPSN